MMKFGGNPCEENGLQPPEMGQLLGLTAAEAKATERNAGAKAFARQCPAIHRRQAAGISVALRWGVRILAGGGRVAGEWGVALPRNRAIGNGSQGDRGWESWGMGALEEAHHKPRPALPGEHSVCILH